MFKYFKKKEFIPNTDDIIITSSAAEVEYYLNNGYGIKSETVLVDEVNDDIGYRKEQYIRYILQKINKLVETTKREPISLAEIEGCKCPCNRCRCI